jgi:hypothetical protein
MGITTLNGILSTFLISEGFIAIYDKTWKFTLDKSLHAILELKKQTGKINA